jgi:hypothetical protein
VNSPQGASLSTLWASSTKDAWAVGAPPVALHWDGRRWTRAELSTEAPITSVWGSGRDAWLLTSDGAVLHGDGARFAPALPPGSVRGWIRGSGPRDVWAGDHHWDGERWTRFALVEESWEEMNGRGIKAVALGGGEAFALVWFPLSPVPACARFDGANWKGVSCPPRFGLRPGLSGQTDLLGLCPWSSGHGDLWVAGITLEPPVNYADWGPVVGSWLARWDGGAWSPAVEAKLPLLTGGGPDDVWFGAPSVHFDGATWSPVEPPDGVIMDVAAAPGIVFALRWPGTVLARSDGRPSAERRPVSAKGTAQWREVLDVGPDVRVVGRVAGVLVGLAPDTSMSDGTMASIVRFDGDRWVTVARATAPFYERNVSLQLFGLAMDDLWVVRRPYTSAYHWDGSSWSAVPYPGEGHWSAGAAARGRAWFIGDERITMAGLETHRFRLWSFEAETGFVPIKELGDDDVSSVAAFESGETLVFATRHVGTGDSWSRVLWRHDGTRWREVWSDAPSREGGFGWGPVGGVRRPDDVWAFANAPIGGGLVQSDLLHWDGARMQSVLRLRGSESEVAAVVRDREVWVSARRDPSDGYIWRTTFRSVTPDGLDPNPVAVLPAIARGIWTTPDGRVFALSDRGAVWEARARCEGN